MKRLLTLTILAALATPLGAQTLPLLYCPTDPHSAALGGAGATLEADAWSLDNNFAAAALTSGTFAIGAAYDYWAPKPAPDTRFNAGGWYRSNRLAFGLAAKGSFSQPYDVVSPAGQTTGSFEPSDIALAAGLAWCPANGFSLGVTARMIASSLSEEVTGAALCADLSAMYRIGGLSLGLAACNLGGQISYGDASYDLPLLFKGGVGYSTDILNLTAEADYLSEVGVMGCLGAECWLASVLCLRGGYHIGLADQGLPSFASGGIGLLFNGLGIDVAVLFASPTLGGSVLAGLTYSF